MHRGGVVDETFGLGVAVEARHRGQASSDHGPRLAGGLEHAGERLDVGAVHLEDRKVVGGAEREELAEVAGVGVTGEPAVAAEEPGNSEQDRFLDGVAGDDRAVGATDMAGLLGVVTRVTLTPARDVILNAASARTCRRL